MNTKREIIGSDFHGTFQTHPEIRGETDFIVTGESWENYEDIRDEKEGKDVPIFFNPHAKEEIDLMKIVNHKADIINKAHATKFYENNPEQASMLKLLCPNCRIILVLPNQTVI